MRKSCSLDIASDSLELQLYVYINMPLWFELLQAEEGLFFVMRTYYSVLSIF